MSHWRFTINGIEANATEYEARAKLEIEGYDIGAFDCGGEQK